MSSVVSQMWVVVLLFDVQKYHRRFCLVKQEETLKLKWVRTTVEPAKCNEAVLVWNVSPLCDCLYHKSPFIHWKVRMLHFICTIVPLFCLECRRLFRFNRILINMGCFFYPSHVLPRFHPSSSFQRGNRRHLRGDVGALCFRFLKAQRLHQPHVQSKANK